jgi:hypothetical protein
MGSSADFLGTTVFPRAASEGWHHWTYFASPPDALDPLRSFGPIFRLSRAMIRCYVEAVETGQWRGHFEAVLPSIARHYDLRIEDLGGVGPFCPKAWRGRNYSNNLDSQSLCPGTLVYRPVQSTYYFHEAPDHFSQHDVLFHPVKPRPSLIKRVFHRLSRETQPSSPVHCHDH